MAPQTGLALLFLAEGAIMTMVALPLIYRKIPRNHIYGFRVPKTLKSDYIWYAANHYAGRCLFAAGRVIILGSLILLPIAHWFSLATVSMIGLLLTFSPIIIALWRSFRYLKRL